MSEKMTETIKADTSSLDRVLLDSLMQQVSEFGNTGDGGVDRPALTDDHKAVRDWFCDELRARGYEVLVDSIGNVFGQIQLAGECAPSIMIGSHLDSQPKGGRFDGAYGVIAALSVVESWRKEIESKGVLPSCNIIIADWMNEEGARFQPSLLGSSVYAGAITHDFALSRSDINGRTVEQELQRTGYLGKDAAPKADIYLEVHIEGDTKMEESGARIAPFIRYWGATKLRIEVVGEQNHTGPTPMEMRRDAVLGAAYIIEMIRELSNRAPDTLYTSVARVDISPNSPNIIPGRAVLFAELRAPEPATLNWAEQKLVEALPGLSDKAAVSSEIVSVERRPAGKFDPYLVKLVETTSQKLGLSKMRLDTIAGHDAVAMNAIMPSLVFAVPSVNGIIHRNDEYTSFEDLAAGADVLLDMVRMIDASKGSISKAAGAI